MEKNENWKEAKLITLTNSNNMQVKLSNFGARIVSIQVPLQDEGVRELAVGFDELSAYQESPYLGATIGRTAGRIAQGLVEIDGETIQLQQNEGTTTLHGGENSFEAVVWKTVSLDKNNVVMEHISLDGMNGFPGNLSAQVSFTVTDDNEVIIEYHSKSDKDTLYNPTNHVYFNLDGSATQPVFEHSLQVKSNEILTLNEDNTMSGNRLKVKGTVFDFQKKSAIKQIFTENEEQITLAGGLDHPFLLDSKEKEQAILESSDKIVSVKMTTDQECVVIYTIGRWAEGMSTSTGKLVYGGAVTLEAQQPPGSERFKELPSIILNKNEPFYSRTSYQIVINEVGLERNSL